MTLRRLFGAGAAIVSLAAFAGAPATAQDVASFYKGRQMTIVVGSSAGGGYDTYARLVGRHMGKHIPGNPIFIVQNMPGAGGNVSANYLYNVAPKDGTVIGAYQSGVILEPLLGKTPVKHDPSKAIYLGSANDDVYICIARADAPAKSFQDVLNTELILSASQSSSTADYPEVINAVLKSKFKVVTGYAGSREIALAIERGEAQGACGLAWPSINATQPGWFDTGRMKVILQTHATGHPELNAKGVPLAHSFAKTAEDRAMLDLFFSQSRFGRPFVIAPEVPKDRADALRKAFAATMQDPDARAEASKMRLDMEPVSAADVQEEVRKVYASPPAIIAKVKAALGN
jgi:tripartite-type tricarboxylate transporter receptor subunit TctC